MQDVKKRASAALRLLRTAMEDDDQQGVDLLASVVERERLFAHYENDAGQPYPTMRAFAEDLEAEAEAPETVHGTRPGAAAVSGGRIGEMIDDLERQIAVAKAAQGSIA